MLTSSATNGVSLKPQARLESARQRNLTVTITASGSRVAPASFDILRYSLWCFERSEQTLGTLLPRTNHGAASTSGPDCGGSAAPLQIDSFTDPDRPPGVRFAESQRTLRTFPGHWHYRANGNYASAHDVIPLLVDAGGKCAESQTFCDLPVCQMTIRLSFLLMRAKADGLGHDS